MDSTERAKVRSVVNEAWKTAYHFLGRNEQRPLDDDRFLGNQFILYVGPTLFSDKDPETSRRKLLGLLRDDEYKTYLLDNLFTSRNLNRSDQTNAGDSNADSAGKLADPSQPPPLEATDLYNYAHDIKSSVQIYYKLLNPEDSDHSDEQKVVLTQLNRLGWGEALPLGLAVALTSKGPAFTGFLTVLERHLFLRTLVSPPYYRFDEPNVIEMAIKFKRGATTLQDTTNALHLLTEKHLVAFGTSDLIPTAYHRGYYGWRTLRYLLFEYEQDLKRKARARQTRLHGKNSQKSITKTTIQQLSIFTHNAQRAMTGKTRSSF